mgnify:CR=1 FL=1
MTANTLKWLALPVLLAGATLIVVAGRTQLAFRQLLRMADLRRQATTDDLTGLANRTSAEDALARQLSLSERSGRPSVSSGTVPSSG